MKKIFKVFGVLVASIFVIAIFQLISPVLLVLCGYGIWYYMKKAPNPKRMKLAIVGTVISLFGTFALMTSGGENSASETTAKQSQTESSSTKEKTQKKLAAEEKAKAESEQENLLKNATAAIALVDKEPSRANFIKATNIVGKINKPTQELQDNLKAVEERVVQEEDNLKLAEAAIASAEANQTRETYENAKSTLAVLVIPNSTFTSRLSTVEGGVVEKEAAEQAAAVQVENDRIAAEQAVAVQVENDRIAAEQAAAAQIAAAQAAAQPVGQTVYIAPDSGTKYHFDSGCRGLNNANSTISMTLSAAQAQGYTLCGWED